MPLRLCLRGLWRGVTAAQAYDIEKRRNGLTKSNYTPLCQLTFAWRTYLVLHMRTQKPGGLTAYLHGLCNAMAEEAAAELLALNIIMYSHGSTNSFILSSRSPTGPLLALEGGRLTCQLESANSLQSMSPQKLIGPCVTKSQMMMRHGRM